MSFALVCAGLLVVVCVLPFCCYGSHLAIGAVRQDVSIVKIELEIKSDDLFLSL